MRRLAEVSKFGPMPRALYCPEKNASNRLWRLSAHWNWSVTGCAETPRGSEPRQASRGQTTLTSADKPGCFMAFHIDDVAGRRALTQCANSTARAQAKPAAASHRLIPVASTLVRRQGVTISTCAAVRQPSHPANIRNMKPYPFVPLRFTRRTVDEALVRARAFRGNERAANHT